MEFIEAVLIFGGGSIAGFLGALMGLGGGIVAVPFLNLVIGVPIKVAAASGLVSSLATSCGASSRNLRCEGMVDIGSALPMQLATAVGSLLGAVSAGFVSGAGLQLVFSLLLLYGAFLLFRSIHWQERTGPVLLAKHGGFTLGTLLFVLAGFGSGMLGVGGGMLVVPVLHLFLKYPFKQAVAMSNFMMGLTVTPALLAFIQRGELDLGIAVPLAGGVWLGASVGAWLLPKVKTRLLKRLFAGLLLLVAVQMVRKGIEAW